MQARGNERGRLNEQKPPTETGRNDSAHADGGLVVVFLDVGSRQPGRLRRNRPRERTRGRDVQSSIGVG